MKSNTLLLVLLCLVLQSPAPAQEIQDEKKPPAPAAKRTFTYEEQKLLDEVTKRANNAVALYGQGKNAEAENEFRAMLILQKRVLGTAHPDTLTSQSLLAAVLDDQGRHAEAEKEFRAVLAIRERVLGAEHPEVFRSCYNLALCLRAQKKFPEALGFIQRAERGWQKTLGPANQDTKDAKAARERIEAEMKAGK